MEINESLRTFLERGEDSERKTPPCPACTYRLPHTRNRPASLALDLNPIGESGLPIKRKGLMIHEHPRGSRRSAGSSTTRRSRACWTRSTTFSPSGGTREGAPTTSSRFRTLYASDALPPLPSFNTFARRLIRGVRESWQYPQALVDQDQRDPAPPITIDLRVRDQVAAHVLRDGCPRLLAGGGKSAHHDMGFGQQRIFTRSASTGPPAGARRRAGPPAPSRAPVTDAARRGRGHEQHLGEIGNLLRTWSNAGSSNMSDGPISRPLQTWNPRQVARGGPSARVPPASQTPTGTRGAWWAPRSQPVTRIGVANGARHSPTAGNPDSDRTIMTGRPVLPGAPRPASAPGSRSRPRSRPPSRRRVRPHTATAHRCRRAGRYRLFRRPKNPPVRDEVADLEDEPVVHGRVTHEPGRGERIREGLVEVVSSRRPPVPRRT